MGRKSRLLEILPNFLLFFLFACCMFLVLLSGAKLYKNVSGVMEEQYTVQTCVSYLTAKVRHYDSADAVSVRQFHEKDALLLKESIGEKEYVTYLYWHEGHLMELFCEEGLDLPLDAGQTIMPLDAFSVTQEENRLSFYCAAEGKETETVVSLQSGKGVFE